MLSVVGAVAGRNPRGNFEGAAITGVVAFGLIKIGRAIRGAAIKS